MSEVRNLIKSKMVKIILPLLAMVLLVAIAPGGNLKHAKAAVTFNDRVSYYYYMQQYENAIRPDTEIDVDVTAFELSIPGKAEVYSNREGSERGVFIDDECEQITFFVDVPESGLYNIEMKYFPFSTNDMQIMFGVLIDGKLPYAEASSCVLSRIYQNETIRQDEHGNDIRPRATQVSDWRTQYLYDQTGFNGNLAFYLEAGRREITFNFEESSMLIENITIKQEPRILSYQDYISIGKQKGYTETTNIQKIFQAEDYFLQSSSVLWPDVDRSSPLTQPFDYRLKKINYGGGTQWKVPGQWISWKIEVPEDGFYNIGLKYRQGYLDGLFSSRRILIDGEVPFDELNTVRFNYTNQWENMVLGNEYDEPYSFYLTAGEHIITMENVIGDMGSTMEVLQNCSNNLNALYLSIIMITSSDPDKYRDYYLEKQLPDLPDKLRENAQMLYDEAERLIEVVGAKGQETAFFEDVAFDLETYADNIIDLTYNGKLEYLKNNISGLSAKMNYYQEQALDIDYIVLTSADVKMPKVKLSAWDWLVYQVKSFFASFNSIKVNDTADIRVWMGGGNEQHAILQNMINDMFTPKTGIEVDLELVGGSLIEAVVSGTGPDVYIGIGGDAIVNMAIRGALQEVDGYEGYDELLDEYIEGSDIPFTLEGRVYGVPNTGNFMMMFVRTDVFETLGLEIPKTWDEVYDVAQVLQRNNMSLGVVPPFVSLLYQMGGSYYNDDLTKVMFAEDIAVEAFTQYTEFYTKYDFPLSFEFVSRFRTGEMPIALSMYGTYNSLKYSAPEINGLWEMFPMPGTLKEDGSIDYTQAAAAGGGTVIMKAAKNKDLAWEFVKWWSGAEAQERFAKDQEAAMGVSARYGTLNKVIFPNIGWTRKEYAALSEGMQYLRFTPIVPGDYYVARGVDNTFRAVVYNGDNVRELLTMWTTRINEELARKRKEFYKNN